MIHRCGNHGVHIEIAGNARRGQRHALIGQRRVEAARIVGGVHGHRLDPESGGGSEQPHGDLAPVRHQQTFETTGPVRCEHRRSCHGLDAVTTAGAGSKAGPAQLGPTPG